jgi:hypothetical protein
LVLLANTTHSNTDSKPQLNATNIFESVWLWQIDTPNRRLYIAGDWHDHFLSSKETISHRLAYTAYELSGHVLIESVGTKRLGQTQLRNRLTPSTWQALDAAIRKSVTAKQSIMKNLSTDQRNVPNDDVIEFINRLPDNLLVETLLGMLLPLPSAETEQSSIEIGFLKKITLDASKEKVGKLEAIEKPDAVNKAWSENCGQMNDTESLVREILVETGLNAEQMHRRTQEVVSELRNTSATTESMTQRIESLPLWKTANKCTAFPRNIEWMKKIKSELSKDKQPLMIVVGIAHVVGDTGLLSLLCKEGYCQSKRVQLADFIKK